MTTLKLTLIRGVPGSGKTTYAKDVLKKDPREADNFFVKYSGNPLVKTYEFNRDLLEYAHSWCLSNTTLYLFKGFDTVVCNTFVRPWEIQKYLDLVSKFEGGTVTVEIIHVQGNFTSTHDVPDEKVEEMKRRFVSNEELKKVFGNNEKYKGITLKFTEVVPNEL